MPPPRLHVVPQLPRRIHPRRRTLLRLEPKGRALTKTVTNLSVTGMFVEGHDFDAERGALWIPGAADPLELAFRAVHNRPGGLGLEFADLDREQRAMLQAYVAHQRESERLRSFESRLGLSGRLNLKPLSPSEWPSRVLRPLARSQAEVQLFRSADGTPIVANVATVDDFNARLTLLLPASESLSLPGAFDEVFLVVRDGGAWYLADTIVERMQSGVATVMLPERLFLPERRALTREPVGAAIVELPQADRTVSARVLELDANGLAALVPIADVVRFGEGSLITGASLVAEGGDRRALEPLRVVWRASRPEGAFLRLGLQRQLDRVEVDFLPQMFQEKRGLQQAVEKASWAFSRAAAAVGLGARVPSPTVWRPTNARGETIVSLLNATFDPDRPLPSKVHLVLIPPPFARRKEVTSPVALSLVETFRNAGEHVLVVRWDGVHHLGESHHEPAHSHPDYHMVDWTLGQCVEDLATIHAAARERLGASLGSTAIVSFSMAAVAARRYLADGASGVEYWIAPMGASDARDIIANSSGGIDWVGERKRGRRLGVNLIQGWLVDCDRGCDDMIHGRLAELEDARREMAQISQPVTWICGQHDYWVNEHRVRDILGVRSPGPREVLSVPTGHFVRTSTEAMATFRLLAGRVASRLSGREVAARLPSAFTIVESSRMERERLPEAAFDPRAYWAAYLQGTARNPLGFDLLSLTDEYQELMTEQVARLQLGPGARVADLGCGTGNAVEAILLEYGARSPGLTIDAVDFVGPAMVRARQKTDETLAGMSHRPRVLFHDADLSLPAGMPNLPFGDGSLDAVLLSLVVPYLDDPGRLLREVRRILRPGGRVVISSLRPDVDMSHPLRNLREKVTSGDTQLVEGWDKHALLGAIQDYVHAAARLVDREAEGRFHFHEARELEALVRRAGLTVHETVATFGDPKLCLVTVAVRGGA